MKKQDLIGKTFKVGDVNGNCHWLEDSYSINGNIIGKREIYSNLLDRHKRENLEGTITINRITKKDTVFYTLDITRPYKLHFEEMRNKILGVTRGDDGEWCEGTKPYIIRHFDKVDDYYEGNDEPVFFCEEAYCGRYSMWATLTPSTLVT